VAKLAKAARASVLLEPLPADQIVAPAVSLVITGNAWIQLATVPVAVPVMEPRAAVAKNAVITVPALQRVLMLSDADAPVIQPVGLMLIVLAILANSALVL
jgi:hypothetical protein